MIIRETKKDENPSLGEIEALKLFDAIKVNDSGNAYQETIYQKVFSGYVVTSQTFIEFGENCGVSESSVFVPHKWDKI